MCWFVCCFLIWLGVFDFLGGFELFVSWLFLLVVMVWFLFGFLIVWFCFLLRLFGWVLLGFVGDGLVC